MEQISTELPVNPTDKMVTDALAQKPEAELTDQQKILKGFQESLNAFIKKVGEFSGSKRQLQRVLINLAISPLNKEELHHGYTEEKELFDLGTSVNSSKFFLMLSGMEQQGKIAFIELAPVESAPLSDEEKAALAEIEAQDALNMSEVTRAEVPGTEQTADEIRRESL